MRILSAILLMAFACAQAQDFRKLPDWAQTQAESAQTDTPPTGQDAWILFDRTEFAYVGDGKILSRRFHLVKVLTERGRGEGVFSLIGFGGRASKVKKLKGWNLRPNGEL